MIKFRANLEDIGSYLTKETEFRHNYILALLKFGTIYLFKVYT
jgi:hypothetical protein